MNIAFSCFHSPVRWSLGEPLSTLLPPREGARMAPLVDAMQTWLCLDSPLKGSRCPFVGLLHLHGPWKMAEIGLLK